MQRDHGSEIEAELLRPLRWIDQYGLRVGATIEVPTLGGDPVKLRVAPGTPSGRVLRVKGRGVHTAKGAGDLLAEVQVAVPSHLDDQAKEALQRFHELEPRENPRADLMAKARE